MYHLTTIHFVTDGRMTTANRTAIG